MKRLTEWVKNNKIAALLVLAYVLSLIPLLAACVYVYPQADDFSMSWKIHLAWTNTHSLWMTLKAVAVSLSDFFHAWQGTYASLILMSLQPAVWASRLYCIVPFLLIGLLTASTMLFVRELFRNVKSSAWLTVSMLILLVTVQCMPGVADAFFWYNGAMHYMGMYSVGLFLLTCLVKCIRAEKWRWGMCVLACLFAVILAGGNMITGLLGCIGFVTLIVVLFLLRRKEKIVRILPPMVCMYAGFLVNVLAPGNAHRQTYIGERENPILAVIKSFHYGVSYGGGEWLTWVVILMVAILIPIAWKAVGQLSFTFPCPLLVLGYSYCLLSAMFAPTEYAMGSVNTARCLDVTFAAYIMMVAMDVLYIVGWCRKRGLVHWQASLGKKRFLQKWYVAGVLMIGAFGILFTVVRNPQDYATTLTLYEYAKGTLQETSEIIRENIEILESDEKDVTIWQVPDDSLILRPQNAERWQSGTTIYFDKDSVTVVEKTE